jgi:hypothetical protein
MPSPDQTFTPTGTAFAVVSPCSTCMNQNSIMTPEGKPACPRRKWQADQTTYQQQQNGNSDPRLVPLCLYGTEGTPQYGNQALTNPVYDNTGKSALVWIATTRDNSGIRDINDNVVAPSILDPTFIPQYTDWIYCRPLPYIPAQHEAAYRQSGALKEGDVIIAISAENQQNYPTTNVDQKLTQAQYDTVLAVGGVVQKVDLAFNTPRANVDIGHTIAGT